MNLTRRIAKLENVKHPPSWCDDILELASKTPEGMEAIRLHDIAIQKLRAAGRWPDSDPIRAMMMVATETEEGRQAAELGAAAIVRVSQMRMEGGGGAVLA